MGEHLIDGEFQSDKYPTTPRGLVPLKPTDPMAQDLLWEYAERRRSIDAGFSDDLQEALRTKGYIPDAPEGPEGPWKVRNHDEIDGYYEVYNHHDFDIPRLTLQSKPQATGVCNELNRLDAQQKGEG